MGQKAIWAAPVPPAPASLHAALDDKAASGSTPVAASPRVSNANRVVVGFPFSTIRIEESSDTVAVADLIARLCRLLAGAASAEAFGQLAEEADDLATRLQH